MARQQLGKRSTANANVIDLMMTLDATRHRNFTLIVLLLMRDLSPLHGIQAPPRGTVTPGNSSTPNNTDNTASSHLIDERLPGNLNVQIFSSMDETTTNSILVRHRTALALKDHVDLVPKMTKSGISLNCTPGNLSMASAIRKNCSQRSTSRLRVTETSTSPQSSLLRAGHLAATLATFSLLNGTHTSNKASGKSAHLAIFSDETVQEDQEFNPFSWNKLKDLEKQEVWEVVSNEAVEGEAPVNKSSDIPVLMPRSLGAVPLHPDNKAVDSRSTQLSTRAMDGAVMSSDYPEDDLVYTCAGRCGDDRIFPCSCSALCMVYRTCCENFSQDCPDSALAGRSRFRDLIMSDVVCGQDSVFMISSCPRETDRETGEELPGGSVAEDGRLQRGGGNTVRWLHHGMKSSTTMESLPPPKLDSPRSIADKLKRAALRAPLTDLKSGITYINSTVYDCHREKNNSSSSSPSLWALKLEHVKTNPKTLEDLIPLGSSSQYEPRFNIALLMRHLCIRSLIETCPSEAHGKESEENYAAKCVEFFALTVRDNWDKEKYRNRYCAYCNDREKYRYVLKHNLNLPFRSNILQMLMTVKDGVYNIQVRPPAFIGPRSLSWIQATCELSSDSQVDLQGPGEQERLSTLGQGSTCTVKCTLPEYTVRPDGYCKAAYMAKFALSDSGFPPLCPEALLGLAKYISCGMQHKIESMPHAEFRPSTGSILLDSRTNKTLYIFKIEIDLPYQHQLFFSGFPEETFVNWRHLEILVKSFDEYRRRRDICAGTNDAKDRHTSDIQEVTPTAFDVFCNLANCSRLLERSIGDPIDRTKTVTYCTSPVSQSRYYEEGTLVCKESFTYSKEAEEIEDFRKSPCFFHLENIQMGRGTGSSIRAWKGESLLEKCLLATAAIMMKRR